MQGKITAFEYYMFAMYAILTSKVLTLPCVIYNVAGHDAIISLIFNLLLDILLIFFITLLIVKNPETTIFEFLTKKITKVGAYIVISIIAIFLFLKTLWILEETYEFLIHSLFEEFSTISFFLPAFFIAGYMAIKGVNTLGRSLEIFAFFVAIGLVLCFINTAGIIPLDTNLPYFRNGIMESLQGTLSSSLYIGNPLVLLFFMGKVKIVKKMTLKTVLSSVVIMIFVILNDFSFYNLMGNSVIYSSYALNHISQFNPYVSDLGHLTWLSIAISTVNLLSQVSLMVYCYSESARKIFKLKMRTIPILCSFVIIYIVCLLLHFNLTDFEYIIVNYFSYPSIIIILSMLLILIILNISRRKKNETISN